MSAQLSFACQSITKPLTKSGLKGESTLNVCLFLAKFLTQVKIKFGFGVFSGNHNLNQDIEFGNILF